MCCIGYGNETGKIRANIELFYFGNHYLQQVWWQTLVIPAPEKQM